MIAVLCGARLGISVQGVFGPTERRLPGRTRGDPRCSRRRRGRAGVYRRRWMARERLWCRRRPGERHTCACRAQPHLLPAGGLLHRTRRTGNGPKAHVCLPGSASPPACRGSASPPACRGSASPPACRGSASPPACRAVALTAPTAGPSRSACQTGRYAQPSPPDARTPAKVAPLVRSEKTRHLPTATRPKPDRPDNPNRPMSILSNSEPALCALAPVPDHQAPPVPVPSPGFARSCARVEVAAATPEPARHAPRLAVLPGRNRRNGDPPPLHAFRHFAFLPACSPAHRSHTPWQRAQLGRTPACMLAPASTRRAPREPRLRENVPRTLPPRPIARSSDATTTLCSTLHRDWKCPLSLPVLTQIMSSQVGPCDTSN